MMKIQRTGQLFFSTLVLAGLTYPLSAQQNQDCRHFDILENFASTGIPPKRATCATFIGQSAKTGTSCFWEYSYRDTAAQKFADSLWQNIKLCRTGKPLAPDLPVNHPDSFKLLEWVSAGVTYRVSLKDKAAQNRTLVFIGVE